MYEYPHTITNGGGEELTFLRRVETPRGIRLDVENKVAPGSGPPMHVHTMQEEALTVVQGRIGYSVPGKEARYAGVGETVVFKAGEAHKFWNAGDTVLHCTGYIEPAHNVEFFLTSLFESQKGAGGARPDPFDGAYLARRYRSEFRMLEIPALVQAVAFPMQVAIGTVLGRYRKYSGAPEPVRRE